MSFSFYIFLHFSFSKVSVGHQWERNFLAVISEREEEMPSIIINRWAMMAIIIDDLNFLPSRFVSSTPAWEMERSKDSITPNLLVNVAVMILFCLIASSMSDSVCD